LTSVDWVPIDGYSGVNITGKVDSTICPWYKGTSLFDVLNRCPVPKREE